MTKKTKRKSFFRVNKFQARILYPILFYCLISCFISIYNLVYIYYLDHRMTFLSSTRLDHLSRVIPWFFDFEKYTEAVPWFVMSVAFMLAFMIFWGLYISNRLVGPYERVLKELDEIVKGKKSTPITIRKGDEMFAELLKRINVLIKKR